MENKILKNKTIHKILEYLKKEERKKPVAKKKLKSNYGSSRDINPN